MDVTSSCDEIAWTPYEQAALVYLLLLRPAATSSTKSMDNKTLFGPQATYTYRIGDWMLNLKLVLEKMSKMGYPILMLKPSSGCDRTFLLLDKAGKSPGQGA